MLGIYCIWIVLGFWYILAEKAIGLDLMGFLLLDVILWGLGLDGGGAVIEVIWYFILQWLLWYWLHFMMWFILLWLMWRHEFAVLVVDLSEGYALFFDEAEAEAPDDFIADTVHMCWLIAINYTNAITHKKSIQGVTKASQK